MSQDIPDLQKSSSNPIPDPNKTYRIYADGVYDIFHVGHAKQLEQAKNFSKKVHLLVGVSGQEETVRLKGPTLMNEDERAATVAACKYTDEVVMPCPWVISTKFLDDKKIDLVAHDAIPYVSANSTDIYSEVKRLGKFLETKRTDGIATSDLIKRIIKNREEFLCFLIRQGCTRKELKITVFYEMKLRFKNLFRCGGPCTRRNKDFHHVPADFFK